MFQKGHSYVFKMTENGAQTDLWATIMEIDGHLVELRIDKPSKGAGSRYILNTMSSAFHSAHVHA